LGDIAAAQAEPPPRNKFCVAAALRAKLANVIPHRETDF
jgi:hypothetical protein